MASYCCCFSFPFGLFALSLCSYCEIPVRHFFSGLIVILRGIFWTIQLYY
jgi:hypothetical protein